MQSAATCGACRWPAHASCDDGKQWCVNPECAAEVVSETPPPGWEPCDHEECKATRRMA